MIVSRVMSEARTATVLLQQIWRIGHAFHATGHDVIDGAARQRFCAHDNSLHATAADLIDCGCLNRLREAGLDGRLPGGGLTETCRKNAAHVGAIKLIGGNTRSFDRCFTRCRAEIGCRNIRKRALHSPHWGPGIRQNDDGIGCAELGHACAGPCVLEYLAAEIGCASLRRNMDRGSLGWLKIAERQWKPCLGSSAPPTIKCVPSP